MNKKLLLLSLPIFLSISILFLTVNTTFADNHPTNTIFNPETGTYYKVVQDIGISWNDAESNAKELSHGMFTGQLAVITTQDENDFITDLLPDESSFWIGLKTSDGDFKWVNGETFDYSNWSSYQPTNGDYEDYVELFEYNGKWNDTVNGNHDVIGYVVEYTAPQNTDIEPIYNPDNGHYYQVITSDNRLTWHEMEREASSLTFNGITGHLVTITSESEDDFILNSFVNNPLVITNSHGFIIGGYYVASDDEYRWITGEPFDYSSMATTHIRTDLGLFLTETGWHSYSYHSESRNYIVEFSP